VPLFMDIHDLHGADAKAIAEAHAADVAIQAQFGVEYIKYWVNADRGKMFCLCHAPDAEAANQVHLEAHGLVAERIIEVTPDLAEAFLGDGQATVAGDVRIGPERHPDTGIRTVLFTDIVDSTSITQRVGDHAAMEIIGFHDTVVRNALTVTEGREIKHTGDGIMACFSTAESAIVCASRIQTDLTAQLFQRGGITLRVRIGAAAGEPVEHHNDLFGATVQLAARLCGAASPEEVLVSATVLDLCASTGFPFLDRGLLQLKGFDQPQAASAVEWRRVVR
jgi:class 3 adenylate cyclase